MGRADGLVGFDESPELFRAAVERVTKRREREKLTGPFELWAALKMPDDRETFAHSGGVPTTAAQLNFAQGTSVGSAHLSILARQANASTRPRPITAACRNRSSARL